MNTETIGTASALETFTPEQEKVADFFLFTSDAFV